MDLWIRSQDKNVLQKTNALYIINTNIEVYTIIDNVNMTKYGTYSTKERALEVFDEIQNILQPVVYIHEPKIDYDDLASSITGQFVVQSSQNMEMELKQAGQFVYQMPEE